MLKTLGLTQVMAQSGLPILADKGSRVGIFEEIFADIGDEQSIEQSLSTFSSHMTNIVDILGKVNQHSLLLLDELGLVQTPKGSRPCHGYSGGPSPASSQDHGDDPLSELKAYGIRDSLCANASMEFDTATLRPTYRFMQGVPGRSNAFRNCQTFRSI